MTIIRLIQDPPHVRTVAQLYQYTLGIVTPLAHAQRVTTVFGPMSDNALGSMRENMQALRDAGDLLSAEGWCVLCLPSLQHIVDRLLDELQVVGYPQCLLDEFTLPLIAAHVFPQVHFLHTYVHSRGATAEYEHALQHYEP